MPQMTVSTRITLMFEATLCFVRRRETDINPLFLPWTDKSMEWRCHTLRQCRGQFGFDGPAKALLLPVTVRALQIGNPEEIICEEHVYQCCRIQPSQRGEIREKARKQTALYKTKVIQSLEQNITENISEQIFQFSQEMLPGDYDIAQVNTLCHVWPFSCLSGMCASRLTGLQTKTLHRSDICLDVEFYQSIY